MPPPPPLRKTSTVFHRMLIAENVENTRGVSPHDDTQQSSTKRPGLQLCNLFQLLILG